MKKLVLVLVLLLLCISCDNTEDCKCEKKTYNLIEDYNGYHFELSKTEIIGITDERASFESDDTFIIIKCY